MKRLLGSLLVLSLCSVGLVSCDEGAESGYGLWGRNEPTSEELDYTLYQSQVLAECQRVYGEHTTASQNCYNLEANQKGYEQWVRNRKAPVRSPY